MLFFKLLKELPWMFAIAFIIWLIIFIIFIKNNKQKISSFFNKHRSTFIAIIVALILTALDIWLFVQYIPTHFRKNTATEQTTQLNTNDAAQELQTIDTAAKPIPAIISKETATAKKIDTVKATVKIHTTNTASIRFLSSGSEDIEATNNNAVSILNEQTGEVGFIALIKGFHFENELMQDHFNTPDYMNSDAFPKSIFKGTIINLQTINFKKEGTYPVKATGKLTIHGVTQKLSVTGTITINQNKVALKSVFSIKRIDYGITTNEVADTLQITVNASYN
jgi:hypothetical protein